MFHGSSSLIFAVCKKKKKKKKKVGEFLHMRTSTNLRRRDARKKINDIHGDFNYIHAFSFFFFFYPPPGSTIFAGKSVKHEIN